MIAIFIGGLGLYALAALAMQARAKEISIRKGDGCFGEIYNVIVSKGLYVSHRSQYNHIGTYHILFYESMAPVF